MLWRPVPVWAVLVAMLGAGLLGALTFRAATTTVPGLHGEVLVVDGRLTVTSLGVHLASTGVVADGDSESAAVEMAPALAEASTGTTLGHWTYRAEVRESGPDAVDAGTFRVELFVDGTSRGDLYMVQEVPDDLAAEGVAFTWDLGPELTGGSSVYFVRVTEV